MVINNSHKYRGWGDYHGQRRFDRFYESGSREVNWVRSLRESLVASIYNY